MSNSRPSRSPDKPLKRWQMPLSDDQILTVRIEPRTGAERSPSEQDPWVSDLDNSGDPEVHDLDSSATA